MMYFQEVSASGTLVSMHHAKAIMRDLGVSDSPSHVLVILNIRSLQSFLVMCCKYTYVPELIAVIMFFFHLLAFSCTSMCFEGP